MRDESPQEASDRYAHRFGESAPLSLGVEEELLLVDEEHRGICHGADDVLTELRELRRTIAAAGFNRLGSSALAALIQAIAAKELDRPTVTGLSREALEESYFQAASHGLDAQILLDSETPEPARKVARRMLDSVRPYARELGSEAALDEVERVLREGNGADDQRRVHRERGMAGLLDHLAEHTR